MTHSKNKLNYFLSNLPFISALLIVFIATIFTWHHYSYAQNPTTLRADFNSDGIVNTQDLNILKSNWNSNLSNVSSATERKSRGDANDDRTVDIKDLAILSVEWDKSSGSPGDFGISSVTNTNGQSINHASSGDTVNINGRGFGANQGSSFVVFGERINDQGWAPVARKAAVISWSDTNIRVTVPSMSPGKGGYANTYHPVYVVKDPVGTWAPDYYSAAASRTLTSWKMSNSYNFYMDPKIVITKNTSQEVVNSVFSGNGTWDPLTATYTTNSEQGVWPKNNVNDVLLDGVTLTATRGDLGAFAAGCITLGEGNSNARLTFLNSTITGNMGPGSGGRHGVVGLKIWSQPSAPVTDISFIGTNFGTPSTGGFSDMNIEIVNPGSGGENGSAPCERFALIDCVLEPAGGQALSFGSAGDIFALVTGCTFKGAGYDEATPWHAVFEANCTHYIHWRDSDVWSWDGVVFNVNGGDSDGVSVYNINPHLLFERLNIDFGHVYEGRRIGKPNSSIFMFGYRSHVRIKDCVINTGTDPSYCCESIGTAHPGWEAPNWRNCQHNDFTGTSLTGMVTTNNSGGRITAHKPTEAIRYWDYPNLIPANNTLPSITH